MRKSFMDLPLLVQVILLFVPAVNWIVELLIRWSDFIKSKKTGDLIMAILAIPFGVILGWVDLVCLLLTKKLLDF